MVASWQVERKNLPIWQFIVPFHLRFSDPIDLPYRFTSVGKRASLTKWESLCRRYGESRLNLGLRHLVARKDNLVPNYCLLFKGKGEDPYSAWGEVETAYDTARGMFEFLVSRRRFMLSSPPKPQHRIPHPPWVLAVKEITREVDGFYFAVESFDLDPGSPIEVKSDLMVYGRKYLREVVGNPKSNSTRELIGSSFRLYAQAMDARHNHQAFLGFWQLLETIAIATDQQSSGEQVSKRITAIVMKQSNAKLEALGEIIRDLRQRRNEIVHRGSHERIDSDDVKLLKLFAEIGIEWLTEVRKKLPTHTHLDKYFQHMSANSVSLTATKQAVRVIDRERRSK
jgi:hypothetical protein